MVHKGKLASKIQAEDFGRHVYEHIQQLVFNLQKECMNTIRNVGEDYANQRVAKTIGSNTTLKYVIFSVSPEKKYNELSKVKSFHEVIENFKIDRCYIDQ